MRENQVFLCSNFQICLCCRSEQVPLTDRIINFFFYTCASFSELPSCMNNITIRRNLKQSTQYRNPREKKTLKINFISLPGKRCIFTEKPHKSSYFSGPATQVSPPRLELSGHIYLDFFLELRKKFFFLSGRAT